ncbi:MAG: four helix bundle suffix domain-containing protein [Verrucomicrobiales bacterium]|nr:four helix bundle suffix domain-containing protein [Verrucomicrobiales bacterium]
MSQEQPSPSPEGFLPKTGNYRELISFRKAETIFDFTFRFTEKCFRLGDRTIDQMVQSARSGKQNIAEGAKASVTSTETEIKLTNVARASLEELLIDYQDYLRVRDLPQWDKNSKEALYIRKLGKTADESYETYRQFMATRPPEVLANIAICLIHQANYLLDQQIRRLEKDFVQKGGLRERMTQARLDYRKQQQSQRQPPKPPTRPKA